MEYTAIHYLVAMLKAYEIKHIVSSPGTQNSLFNMIVQQDSDFQCYSVIDERSAAYFATGISHELSVPVVIDCTGASASRNYLSAMTESYYRHIPIIAITFTNIAGNPYELTAQYMNRSVTLADVKSISVELPRINDNKDKVKCLTFLNTVLFEAVYKNRPVHINCPASFDFSSLKDLPSDIWKTEYYTKDYEQQEGSLKNKDVAVFIGSHRKFISEEENALSNFAESHSCPVFCDHTSNYKGKNKVLSAKATTILDLKRKPELIIDIGNVSGDYSCTSLFSKAEIWRVTENNSFACRFGKPVKKTFAANEMDFFTKMTKEDNKSNDYYSYVSENINNIKIPDLPLSNPLICQKLAEFIPKGSTLHHSVSNTKRCMSFFDFDNSINIACNVGVCGIDGPVSTMVGQSVADKNKKCFGILGDLAFFYDMNVLGQRDIGKNLRIILINNNRGEEFRLNPSLEQYCAEKADVLISAAGHNKGGASGWAKSCGFHYMSARTKDEFLNQIYDFCNAEFENPVLFEIFTTDEDEKKGLNLMKTYNKSEIEEKLKKYYRAIKKIIK